MDIVLEAKKKASILAICCAALFPLQSCGEPPICCVSEKFYNDTASKDDPNLHLIYFGSGFVRESVRVTFRDTTVFVGDLVSNPSAGYTGVTVGVFDDGSVAMDKQGSGYLKILIPASSDSVRSKALKLDIGPCQFDLVLRKHRFILVKRDVTSKKLDISYANREFRFL